MFHFIKRPTDVSELAVVLQSPETFFRTQGREGTRLRLRFMGKGRERDSIEAQEFIPTRDCSPFWPPLLGLISCWF